MEQLSTSPEDQWEDWMDWDPKPRNLINLHSTKPLDLIGQTDSRKSSPVRADDRTLPPKSKASDSGSKSSRKRKVSPGVVDSPNKLNVAKSSEVQARSHSLVEKRYRNNLNDKITDVRLPLCACLLPRSHSSFRDTHGA